MCGSAALKLSSTDFTHLCIAVKTTALSPVEFQCQKKGQQQNFALEWQNFKFQEAIFVMKNGKIKMSTHGDNDNNSFNSHNKIVDTALPASFDDPGKSMSLMHV